ncbi:MAG: YcbK family protein [Nitrospira sp.]
MNRADQSKWIWTRRAFLQTSLVGTLLLSGQLAGPQPVQARGLPEGRLTLVNERTDESLDVTYRDEAGEYDLEALDDVNYLMRCHYSGEIGAIDVRVLEHINLVQKKLGTKRDVHFISGFRSPEYNALLVRKGGHAARNSLHMQGQAIDLMIPGVHPKMLRQAALELRYGGVGFYKRSRFVHLDSGPFRFWSPSSDAVHQ